MADYEKKLNLLKENLDKAKSIKYRAEARLEQLYKQKEEIVKELQALDVNPDDLDKEIETLTKEIEELFKQSNDLLPKDILEKK